MVVDSNCEDGSNSPCVNLSALLTISPTMATQLVRDELDYKSYSSGDYSYHLFDRSDDDIDIIDGDTDIRIQEPL